MAVRSCTKGVSYKLRCGQPQPQRGCPSTNPTREFVLQTFGGERRTVRTYKATNEILESNDMIGLNALAEFESASYQGTNYTNKDGDLLLTGQETELVEYIDESKIPGVKNFTFK
jgi:hypothetical protein